MEPAFPGAEAREIRHHASRGGPRSLVTRLDRHAGGNPMPVDGMQALLHAVRPITRGAAH